MCPFTLTVPVVGVSVPATIRRTVLLPDPLAPSSAARSPACSTRSIPPTASSSSKRRVNASTARTGEPGTLGDEAVGLEVGEQHAQVRLGAGGLDLEPV